MLSFEEKLTFLLHLSHTSNKELAKALSVDPSLISLMRTGKRRLSKNPEHARNMAVFFAQRCSAPFQRQALSEMLGQVAISPSMPVETLTANLESWLRGEEGTLADRFLSGISAAPVPEERIQEPVHPSVPVLADEGQTRFFFGPEGRREVVLLLLKQCQNMDRPGTILAVVDDNLEWMLSDYMTSKTAQSTMLKLLEQGFSFHQVVPPMNNINRYTESMHF